MKARIAESLLFGFPMTIIVSIMIQFAVGLDLAESLVILFSTSLAMIGAVLVSTGNTTYNPYYDDTQSKSFKDNTGIMMSIIMF